jgi:hypothetical protein
VTEAVEVKCLSSARHIQALPTQEVPDEYEDQVIQYFIVNDALKAVNLVFYDPRILSKDYFVLTLTRSQYEEKIEGYLAYEDMVTRKEMGTRYGQVVIRILVNPEDLGDVKQIHDLQDAIKVAQKSSGEYEVPNFDPVSQKKVRDALLLLGTTIPDTKRMFGSRSEVDPVRHLIGSAILWGGLPEQDALYLNVTPDNADGTAVYQLNVQGVPVDGFWSVTVYNAKGNLVPNQYNAYSLNNITAKKNSDGSVTVQFGGCDGKISNCLPTMPDWNYMMRLYRPRVEALNGTWKFPQAQLVH